MREIVIVISDLYLASAEAEGVSGIDANTGAAARDALPGFEHAARFGRKERIEGGWRSWLACWLGRDDLASLAPAAVAAAVAEVFPTSSTVWIATPVHLIASLTRLHLDRRGILRLSAEDLASFATDFARIFGDSEFQIKSISSGNFIIQSLATLDVATTEPARAVAGDLEASLPKGRDAAVLKRLGAELEMWLHDHPINEARRRRGELPVSTLWLWGGGAAIGGSSAPRGPAASASHVLSDVAFGSDPYLTGLWRLHGGECHPLPSLLSDLPTHPHPHRAVFVAEIAPLLHANSHWTVFEALAEIDRRFVSPALAELHRGAVANVVLVANDKQLRIHRGDRLKFWRRRQSDVEGLR